MALAHVIAGLYSNAKYRFLPGYSFPIRYSASSMTRGALAYRADGLLAEGFSSSPYLYVRDGVTNSVVANPAPGAVVSGVAWSPTGDRLAVSLYRTTAPNIIVYDAVTWAIVGSYGASGLQTGIAWSGDGAHLIYTTATSPYWGRVAVATGTIIPGAPSLGGAGASAAAHPTSSMAAVGGNGSANRVFIVDTSTGAVTAVTGMPTGTYSVGALAWSPDGTKLLAAAGNDYSVLVIDPVAASVTTRIGLLGAANACAWFPDSDTAIAHFANAVYTTRVFSVTGTLNATLSIIPYTATCYALAVSPALDIPAVRVRAYLPDGSEADAASIYAHGVVSGDVGSGYSSTALSRSGIPGYWNDTDRKVYCDSEGATVLSCVVTVGDITYRGATTAHMRTGVPDEVVMQLVPDENPALQEFGNQVTVLTPSGPPADTVRVSYRKSGMTAAIATPGAGGAWTTGLAPGVYDITYLSDGCRPVTHGPYTVTPAE